MGGTFTAKSVTTLLRGKYVKSHKCAKGIKNVFLSHVWLKALELPIYDTKNPNFDLIFESGSNAFCTVKPSKPYTEHSKMWA